MSAWKDEYKNHWPAELKRARLLRTALREAENNFERSERYLARRILINQILNGIYYALTAAVIIAVIWFALFLFGVVPG